MMGPLGLFLPYYGLFLRENAGLDGMQVGTVFAVIPLVALVMQPTWGVVADRTGLRARLLILISLGASLGYVVLGRAEGFVQLLFATALLAVFSRSLIPITVSVSLPALEDHPHAFGIVRAWGTVGFGAAMFGFPALLDRIGPAAAPAAPGVSEPGLGLLFPAASGLALLAALAVGAVPNRGAVAVRALPGEWRSLLHNRPFLSLVVVGFAAFLCLNGPMELFPIFVRDRGGDLDTVRAMWIPMLLPEIVLVACLGSVVARLGPRRLLAVGVAAAGVRWLLCGVVHSLAWLYPVQALHSVVVLGLMLGAPLYVDAVVPPALRSTAQASFGMVAVGLGGVGSSLLAGSLLELGGASAPYWVGGTGAIVLGLLVPRLLPEPIRDEE